MIKKAYIDRVMILLAALAMVVPGVSAQAARSDTVRVALRYDPTTVNILELKSGIDVYVTLTMNECLVGTDPVTGKRVLQLAESYEVLPSKKDIKITLRKGVTFSTGDPLTAADVKWSYQQFVDPKNANIMAGPLEEVEEIEVIDDRTLIFHFYEPYAAWTELMVMGICSKKYYDRVGPEQFRKHPVGSGVFKFVSRRISEKVVMEVNRNYWNKQKLLPNFRYLEFVTVPDEQTRQAMLEAGELDMIYELSPHQLKRLKTNKHVKIKRNNTVPSMYGMGGRVYGDKILKDVNFCQAVNHAINRQELVDKIFLGEGYPLYQFVSRSELGYDSKIKLPYDPKKAKEFLKKSSYKPGYPIMVTYTSNVPNGALVAAAIQQYLQAVGINAQIRQLEAGTEATYTRMRDPRIGAYVLYAWAGGRDPSTRLLLCLKSTSPYASYVDRTWQKELDELVDAQAREMDVNKRAEMLRKMHAKLLASGDSIILFGLNMIYATSDRIEYTWPPEEGLLVNLDTIRVVK